MICLVSVSFPAAVIQYRQKELTEETLSSGPKFMQSMAGRWGSRSLKQLVHLIHSQEAESKKCLLASQLWFSICTVQDPSLGGNDVTQVVLPTSVKVTNIVRHEMSRCLAPESFQILSSFTILTVKSVLYLWIVSVRLSWPQATTVSRVCSCGLILHGPVQCVSVLPCVWEMNSTHFLM